jgi:hypothetical protein
VSRRFLTACARHASAQEAKWNNHLKGPRTEYGSAKALGAKFEKLSPRRFGKNPHFLIKSEKR